MDLCYRIDWPVDFEEVSLGHNGKYTSAWSSLNIVAFTSEKNEKGCMVQYLNIFNPNLCWDVFSTHYSYGQITCMEWDHAGKKLVVGDLKGYCSVWVMQDMMSNQWRCQNKIDETLLGEEILCIGWLHCGIRIPFKSEQPCSPNKRFKPSLNRFGRKPVEGYLAVTSSGRIAFKICDQYKQVVVCQLNIPCHQELADIAFSKDGNIKIVMSNGKIRHLIRTFDIRLQFDNQNKAVPIVNVAAGLIPKCTEAKDNPYTFVSHVKFITRDYQDHLLICVSGPNGSMFESSLLRPREVQLHRIFQQSPATYTPELTLGWKFAINSENMPRVKNFSVPPLAVNTSSTGTLQADQNRFFCGFTIAVALADNTIRLLHRVWLKQYVSVSPSSMNNESIYSSSNPKRPCHQTSSLQQVIFSPMSCALLAFEQNGGAYLCRVPPWLTTLSQSSNNAQVVEAQTIQIVQLLQHCLISGCDWWDITLNIDTKLVDSVVKLLTAEYFKWPPALRQVLQTKLDAMKITIYHIVHSPVPTDLYLKLMLNAITLVFRSLILPQNRITSEEHDPAEKLKNISRNSMEKDVDKMVHNLDADPQTLQSMQQLIQWVADIVLYILASVPYYKYNSRPGFTLLRDREFLSTLRENLVLIRVWGLLKQACMPLFTKINNELDVISHSFELVTMLWQASLEDVISDLPKNLVNECSLLPMKVLIPPLVPVTPPSSVIYHQLASDKPLQFTFGRCKPDPNLTMKRSRQQDFVKPMSGQTGKVDMLRWISLGKSSSQPLKQCTRCGVISLFNSQQRPPVRVWEQRFALNCICGGSWRKMSRRDAFLL